MIIWIVLTVFIWFCYLIYYFKYRLRNQRAFVIVTPQVFLNSEHTCEELSQADILKDTLLSTLGYFDERLEFTRALKASFGKYPGILLFFKSIPCVSLIKGKFPVSDELYIRLARETNKLGTLRIEVADNTQLLPISALPDRLKNLLEQSLENPSVACDLQTVLQDQGIMTISPQYLSVMHGTYCNLRDPDTLRKYLSLVENIRDALEVT